MIWSRIKFCLYTINDELRELALIIRCMSKTFFRQDLLCTDDFTIHLKEELWVTTKVWCFCAYGWKFYRCLNGKFTYSTFEYLRGLRSNRHSTLHFVVTTLGFSNYLLIGTLKYCLDLSWKNMSPSGFANSLPYFSAALDLCMK